MLPKSFLSFANTPIVAISWFAIGIVYGWIAARMADREDDFLRFLFFPFSTCIGGGSCAHPGGDYLLIMGAIWPLRLAWNAFFVAVLTLPFLIKLARARNFAVPKNGTHPA